MKFMFTFYNRFVGLSLRLELEADQEREQLKRAWTDIYSYCQEQYPDFGEYKDWMICSVTRQSDQASLLVPRFYGKGDSQ